MGTNPEILAINAIDRVMGKLPDEPTRERVLAYIESKYIPKVPLQPVAVN